MVNVLRNISDIFVRAKEAAMAKSGYTLLGLLLPFLATLVVLLFIARDRWRKIERPVRGSRWRTLRSTADDLFGEFWNPLLKANVAVYGLMFLWFVGVVVSGDQDELRKTRAALDARKYALYPGDFGFDNMTKLSQGFVQYRYDIGLEARCALRITSPENGDPKKPLASTVTALTTAARCAIDNPDLSYRPELRKEMESGVRAKKVIFHARKDARGALRLYNAISEVLPLELSYEVPEGSPDNFIWLQFGPDVMWNREMGAQKKPTSAD